MKRSISAPIRYALGIFLLCAFNLRAETIPDLYTVSVPVSEQSQSELQRAATIGLRELVVRISGRSDAGQNQALSSLFANASRYLDQYRYERYTGGEAPWLAQLRFASNPIDSALRNAGLPIWGDNRPALQVWLMLDDGKSRSFVDANSVLANTLREQWRRRGLLLHFPNNFGAVTSDEVWRLDATQVRGSASAERADGFIMGRIQQGAGNKWQGKWVIEIGGQQVSGEGENDTLPAYVTLMLDRIVDSFSPQYAVTANSATEGIVLRITGVTTFDDYAAVLNYLRRLGAIKSAMPMLLRGDELLLQLNVEGSAEHLARQLALETRLTPAESSTTQTSLPIALNYRWTMARN